MLPAMNFNDTPTSRLDELIQAAQRATPATPDDQDELADIAAGLKAIQADRVQQVHVRVRTYVFGAIRRAATETQVATPDIPLADIKAIVEEELALLLVDGDAPTLLDQALDGTAPVSAAAPAIPPLATI